MIEGLSHITFTVRNTDKTAELFKRMFNAKEVYYNGEKKHSLFEERFFYNWWSMYDYYTRQKYY